MYHVRGSGVASFSTGNQETNSGTQSGQETCAETNQTSHSTVHYGPAPARALGLGSIWGGGISPRTQRNRHLHTRTRVSGVPVSNIIPLLLTLKGWRALTSSLKTNISSTRSSRQRRLRCNYQHSCMILPSAVQQRTHAAHCSSALPTNVVARLCSTALFASPNE